MNILVTGSAGFIGFHTAKKLLARGDNIIGVDNFNDYYEVSLKEDRNKILEENPNYKLYRLDLSDYKSLAKVFQENKIDKICNLAAQAGVRYSLENPHVYIKSNIDGFVNLLELARQNNIKDFVYASSSSVYGQQEKIPFSESDNVDRPISLYAATKKSNELIAYTYHHLYGLNCTGLRFFTVIGPWGRPDMALFKFAKAINEGKAIKIYNHGHHQRDFTYIDDIIQGVISSLDNPFGYEVINLGNNSPVELMDFISWIEKYLDKKAKKEMLPAQPGDVDKTYADITKAQKLLNYQPQTSIEEAVQKFIKWYKEYY